MAGLKLEKHKKESINSNILEFKNPKGIYILVNNGKVLVETEQKIYKGMPVVQKENRFDSLVCSSVSGICKGIVEIENEKYIFIENDFKEKEQLLEIKEKYTKQEFIEQIKKAGIIGLGGAGFPTFVKYQVDDIETLIVNAVECEPYITADYMLIMNKSKEIIEGIQKILEINNIKECYIGIKEHNEPLKKELLKYVKNSNIHVVEVKDRYPMGWEKALIKATKHVDYQKLPSERNIIVNNISTIYAIYDALVNGKALTERIVTVTGDIENPCNMIIKSGTSLEEILNNLKINTKSLDMIAGGPMMGKFLENDSFVLDSTVNCLLFLKSKKECIETNCLRCGKCVRVCPVSLDPVLIRDSINDRDILNRLDPNRCIECGLCSYICPANIKLREIVKDAKNKLRKEGSK